jgi:AGZA family xanthine/uracil permease-like MFS transporter
VSRVARFFRIAENGSSLRTEVLAGFTTFATMSYVLAVHPRILAATGMDFRAVITVTALAAAAFTVLMGLVTNYPLALAPAMGVNAFFAYQICLGLKVPWPAALGLVFYSGILFLVLSLSGLRQKLIESFPEPLKKAIIAGIGLFIAFIGFKNSGIIVSSPAPLLVGLGDMHAPSVVLAFIGLVLTCLLMVRRFKGAMIISILAITALGAFWRQADGTTVTQWPHSVFGYPASPGPVLLKLDLLWFWRHWQAGVPIILAILFADLFSSMAAFLALGARARLLDSSGNLPKLRQALAADALAAAGGAMLGTSTVIVYIESASGVEEGGRTGLTSMVVAACFIASLFFGPLIAAVPPAATAPALVIIGIFMMSELGSIDFSELTHAAPAALTVLLMLLATIQDGMAIGLLFYVLLCLVTGKARQLTPVSLVLAVIFLLRYVF